MLGSLYGGCWKDRDISCLCRYFEGCVLKSLRDETAEVGGGGGEWRVYPLKGWDVDRVWKVPVLVVVCAEAVGFGF